MAHLVSFDTVWTEITKAYDTTFLKALLKMPGVHVYAFGGIVVDLSLGNQWKDLDLRVIYEERDRSLRKMILDVLKRYTSIVQEFSFPGGVAYRVYAPAEKRTLIDVTVSGDFEGVRIDSKICAIFIDLKSGTVRELYKGSIEDFKNGIIRPINGQIEQIAENPLYLFRALKLAVKTRFAIDVQFEKILRDKRFLIRKAVSDTVSYLRENGKDSIGENFLGSIFGGLRQDAPMYVNLLIDYGFLEEMCEELQKLGYGKNNSMKTSFDCEPFKNELVFEEKLSLFLSSIAKSISDSPSVCFESLKKAFAFDTDRSDGNEFVVDPTKIVFVS